MLSGFPRWLLRERSGTTRTPMDRQPHRWSDPVTRGGSHALRARAPRTPEQVLRHAANLTRELRSCADPNRLDERQQLAPSATCCRLLLGLLDVRHALRTEQLELLCRAAAALRGMLAASGQLAHAVLDPAAVRAICSLVHINFPPWEQLPAPVEEQRGKGSAPAATATRHAGQLGYAAVPGAAVVLSEQAWDERGNTQPNAPAPQLIADPGWRFYPPEDDDEEESEWSRRRNRPADPRSAPLRVAQREAVQLLLVLCGHGAARVILKAVQGGSQLLDQLCALSSEVPYRFRPPASSQSQSGDSAVWEERCPPSDRHGRMRTACDAMLLLGALAGQPGVKPLSAIGDCFFSLVEGFELCLLPNPAAGGDAQLARYVAKRGCVAVSALRDFSHAHDTITKQMACSPKVPLVHMLLQALHSATLNRSASVPFQAEAAALALPALDILDSIGRHCPRRLTAEASPDGCNLLVQLMDESVFTAAASLVDEALHRNVGWRRAVGHAASRVLVHMLAYDGPDGDALHPLLVAMITPGLHSNAVSSTPKATAASHGAGGGHAACSAFVVWSALLCERVDTAALLRVICDSGCRGGAGEEALHRWGEPHPAVRRLWTHPEAIGRSRPLLGQAACGMLHALLCAAEVEYTAFCNAFKELQRLSALRPETGSTIAVRQHLCFVYTCRRLIDLSVAAGGRAATGRGRTAADAGG